MFKKIEQTLSLPHLIKLSASLLVIITLIGFLGGAIKTALDFKIFFSASVEVGLKEMLINIIGLLAVIEVLKTATSYLSDGRVHVTYIVDTILIVMLNEIISFWFKGLYDQFIPLLSIIVTLIVVRIFAIRYSPECKII